MYVYRIVKMRRRGSKKTDKEKIGMKAHGAWKKSARFFTSALLAAILSGGQTQACAAGNMVVASREQVCGAASVQAAALRENKKSAQDDAVSVSSHKQLVNQIYRTAVKRKTSGVFYCKGNGGEIFDGDLDALFQEVCAIDKKTSDDADYLANSVASLNVTTRQEYAGSKIRRTEYTVRIQYRETAEQLKAVNEEVKEVLAGLKVKGKSDYQKVKLIHDYIVNNTRYQVTSNCYSAYGALIEGRAVCQGYAQLAYKMLTEAGVKCYTITGKANNGRGSQNHAWNMVRIGKKWYYLDVTWDDPTGGGDVLQYDYFLAGRSRFEKTHTASDEFKSRIKKVEKKSHKKWKELQR